MFYYHFKFYLSKLLISKFIFQSFPARAYHPKIQFIEPEDSNQPSYALQIEIKRREYASKSIPDLLKKKYGITRDMLIPINDENTNEKIPKFIKEKRKYNFIPLELFDDETYDCR